MSSNYANNGEVIDHHMVVITPMPYWIELLSILFLLAGVVWIAASLLQTNLKAKIPGVQIMLISIIGFSILWASPLMLLGEGTENEPSQGIIWLIHISKHFTVLAFAYGFFKLCQYNRRSNDA